MASKEPNESSSSRLTGKQSPEYLKMRELTVELIGTLKEGISNIGDALFAKGHISDDVRDTLRMSSVSPADKTRRVVDSMTDRIEFSPSAFDDFVKTLKEQGPWTNPIVKKLELVSIAPVITTEESSCEFPSPAVKINAFEHQPDSTMSTQAPIEHQPDSTMSTQAPIEHQPDSTMSTQAPIEHQPDSTMSTQAPIEHQPDSTMSTQAPIEHQPDSTMSTQAPIEHQPDSTMSTQAPIEHQPDSTMSTQAPIEHQPDSTMSTQAPIEHQPDSTMSTQAPITAPGIVCTDDQRSQTLEVTGTDNYGFRCPTCSLCTVDVFLSDSGCPKAGNDSAQLFPFLNTADLTEADKIDLEHRLKFETRQMILVFGRLTRSTKRSLESQKVSVEDLAACLLSLGTFTSGIATKPLLKEDEINIKTAPSIARVFLVLNDYISFFNYEIIEHIIEDFGTNDDRATLDDYLTAFKAFCRRSVFEVPPKVLGSAPTSEGKFKLFAVKYSNTALCTLEKAKQLQEKIAYKLDITLSSLHLFSIVKGCMQLQFLVSTFLAAQIFPLSSSQLKALTEIGIRVVEEPKVSTKDSQSKELWPISGQSLTLKFTSQEPKLSKMVATSYSYTDATVSSTTEAIQSNDAKKLDKTDSITQVQWSSRSGKTPYGAVGRRDVLLLASLTDNNPDIVPRKPRKKLIEKERQKLKRQGISRDSHHDDLSIMTARYGLDKDCTIVGVESGRELTCEGVKKQIASLLSNTDKEGVVLYYIGSGKTRTGDWCFSDGFITFRELMDLYNQHYKGHVLTIISDCSYSGSWVKECMVFMDEQGVGPCGHVAKEKGILVKVYASCLSNEIPAELAFSTHTAKNDRYTGIMTFTIGIRSKEIRKDQHPSGIDVTEIQCKNQNIDEPCTMAPGSTWQRWNTAGRIHLVRGMGKGRPAWHYVKVEDDKEEGTVDVIKYGEPLQSGWGEDPPDDLKEQMKTFYSVDYNYIV